MHVYMPGTHNCGHLDDLAFRCCFILTFSSSSSEGLHFHLLSLDEGELDLCLDFPSLTGSGEDSNEVSDVLFTYKSGVSGRTDELKDVLT
jgi:hypothetical protein